MTPFFNEFDPFAAQWLRNLYPQATVGARSIKDVQPADVMGTTIAAAIRRGQKAIGIEKDARYFDIAVRRIEKELAAYALFEPPPRIVAPASLFGNPE